MKYTIEGFNQEAALNMKKETEQEDGSFKTIKIDCIDLVILRWFVDFYPNMTKVNVDGEQYAWLSYKGLLEDMPLLDIKKRMLEIRIKKLVDLEILTRQTIRNERGTFSCYSFGSKYADLVRKEGTQNITDGAQNITDPVRNKLQTPSVKNCRPNNNSTNDPSTNNPSIKREGKAASRFTPPTVEEVRAYCLERKNNVNPEKFIDYYTSNGWKVGKNPMKDWKAAVRTWEKNSFDNRSKQQPAQPPKQETEEERLRREQDEKLLALIEGRA